MRPIAPFAICVTCAVLPSLCAASANASSNYSIKSPAVVGAVPTLTRISSDLSITITDRGAIHATPNSDARLLAIAVKNLGPARSAPTQARCVVKLTWPPSPPDHGRVEIEQIPSLAPHATHALFGGELNVPVGQQLASRITAASVSCEVDPEQKLFDQSRANNTANWSWRASTLMKPAPHLPDASPARRP